jgi:hypothetical protein
MPHPNVPDSCDVMLRIYSHTPPFAHFAAVLRDLCGYMLFSALSALF